MATLVIALLISHAYSAPVTTTVNFGLEFTHEIVGTELIGKLVWIAAGTDNYFAIALGTENFEGPDADVIACSRYASIESV